MRIIPATGLAVLLLAGCAEMQDNPKQTLGAIGGAGIGALIGSQIGGGKGQLAAVVIGTATSFIRLGLALNIAQAMDAKYLELEDLRAETLAEAVRQELPGLGPTPSVGTNP